MYDLISYNRDGTEALIRHYDDNRLGHYHFSSGDGPVTRTYEMLDGAAVTDDVATTAHSIDVIDWWLKKHVRG